MVKKSPNKILTSTNNKFQDIHSYSEYFANTNLVTVPTNKVLKQDEKYLFILDINPCNDQITNELLTNDTKEQLQILANNPNNIVIFASYYRFDVVYQYICGIIGIRRGYIICNAGSRLYSIHKNEFLDNVFIGDDAKRSVAHFAIIQSIFVLASTLKQDLCYTLNENTLNLFNKAEFIPRNSTSEYVPFSEFINLNNICSYICYEPNTEELLKRYSTFKTLQRSLNLQSTTINNNMFAIIDRNCDFLNMTYEVMELENFKNFNHVFYICLNCFCSRLWFLCPADQRYICMDHYISNAKFLPQDVDYSTTLFISAQISHLIASCNDKKHFSVSIISRNQFKNTLKNLKEDE